MRERFADTAAAVTYAGAFEIVRASLLGRAVRVARHAVRHAGGAARRQRRRSARAGAARRGTGVAWDREYRWADGSTHLVRSTKVVDARRRAHRETARATVHAARDVYEEGGVLHFVSRGYYFDLGLGLEAVAAARCCPPASRTSSTSTSATAGSASP